MNDEMQTLLEALEDHEPDWTVAWLIEHADPELWAPRQFIVVDELTKGSPTLAALWRTIYRLWLFYKPLGRSRFGFRLIARVGGLGRNYIAAGVRDLHRLGLLAVHGIAGDPGLWQYDFDPAQLEARSIRLIRSRLAAGYLVTSRRRPEAQQRDLFAALELAPAEAILDLDGAGDKDVAFIEIPRPAPLGATPKAVLAPMSASFTVGEGAQDDLAPVGARSQASRHQLVPGPARHGDNIYGDLASTGASSCDPVALTGANSQPARHSLVPTPQPPALDEATCSPRAASVGDTWPHRVPQKLPPMSHDHSDLAPERAHGWMDGEIERERERDPQHTHAPSFQMIEELIERSMTLRLSPIVEQLSKLLDGHFQSAVAVGQDQPTRASLNELIPVDIPPPPEDEPALPLSLPAIWEMVSRQHPVPEEDYVQIKMLIDRYQDTAQGHSAYWLGRVMLFADMCRKEHEAVKLKLINSYMHRMAEVGFTTEALEDRNHKGERGGAPNADRPARSERRSRQEDSLPPDAHPAIVAYITAFGRSPNTVQSQQIAEAVSDLAIWQQVLTAWQANGWQAGAVAKMLDRYRKDAGAVPAQGEAPVSVAAIHSYPGLSDTQRDRWIKRFHAATTPAEKRAVLTQLEQEHPHA